MWHNFFKKIMWSKAQALAGLRKERTWCTTIKKLIFYFKNIIKIY